MLVIAFGLCAGATAGDAAPEELMEKFRPGKEHESLKKLAGSYDVTLKMWMEPGKDPVETKGAAEFTMEMNGRYLKQVFKGTMMGQPFTGVGYDGFDRTVNKYVGTWLDDFSTQIMFAFGTSKDDGKTIEYVGELGDPISGKMIKTRNVHKTIDDDSFTFEMYQTHGDKEIKCMELVYKRKK
jgi:hypothetical protein